VGWRHSELAASGPEVVSLAQADASVAYNRAIGLCNRTRYGLDESALPTIERLDVNDPGPAAESWLAERVGVGELLLVFGRDDVFRMPSRLFVSSWRDMFCPSRDDVVIMPASGVWALFYSHEDEFEFARL
jgi:hypothetical protein